MFINETDVTSCKWIDYFLQFLGFEMSFSLLMNGFSKDSLMDYNF